MNIEMKKILFALIGVGLLLTGCQAEKSYELEQNPYRKVVEYTPQTITMEVPGTLSADASYDWVTMTQSGNTATFTLRRNTKDVIREAVYTISGQTNKAKIFQKGHALDAVVSSDLTRNGVGEADVRVNLTTGFPEDYSKWGVIYGKVNDRSKGTKLVANGAPSTDGNIITIEGLEVGKDYFVWAFVESTEGDILYGTNTTGIIPPVTVAAGDDLQAAINGAKEFAEIRVAAGAEFNGPIFLRENVKLSGSWVDNYSTQDFSNRSIIDGGGKNRCVLSGFASDGGYAGSSNSVINGFEVRNGFGSGIVFNGKLTVEYCNVHNCENADKGGGITGTEQAGDELLLANSIIAYNVADAHAGGVSVSGSGTKVTVINCLFLGNVSKAQYGYTAAIHGQGGVDATLINNTFVQNVNWRDGADPISSPWSAVMFRNKGTHIVMVNNIIAGNYYFLPGVANNPENLDRYEVPIKAKYIQEMQSQPIDLNVLNSGDYDENWVCQSNLLGGAWSDNFIGRAGNGADQNKAQAACTFVHNDDVKGVFADFDGGDFRPVGTALQVGEASAIVTSVLGGYNTDLAGKPRSTNGKIYAGCYQP